MKKVEKRDPPLQKWEFWIQITFQTIIIFMPMSYLCIEQYFICELSMLYLLNGWSNEESLEKGPPKSGNSEFKSHFKHSSYLCQCHICALTIFYLWTVNVISPKWLVKWRKLRKGTPQKVGILNSNPILNNHHIYANVIFVH